MSYSVNLFPSQFQASLKGERSIRVWLLVSIVIFVIIVALAIPKYQSITGSRETLEEVNAIGEKAEQVLNQLVCVSDTRKQIEAMIAKHERLTGTFPPLAVLALISEVAAARPDQITVRRIEFQNGITTNGEPAKSSNPSVSPQLGNVRIDASLTDSSIATELVDRLRESKMFREVQLTQSMVEGDGESEESRTGVSIECRF